MNPLPRQPRRTRGKAMKLRSVSFAFVVTALSVVACSDFAADSGSTPPTGSDAGDGGTGADGAIDPVGGEATRGITLTAGDAGKNVFVTQTKSTTVPVTVVRKSASV